MVKIEESQTGKPSQTNSRRQLKKVAVLMGGSSYERDFSLSSGRNITKALETTGLTVLPLDTTPDLVDTLLKEQPDAAYIALHGKNGEDGTIQSLLDLLRIPYVGSNVGGCTLAWSKTAMPHLLRLSANTSVNSPKSSPVTTPKNGEVTNSDDAMKYPKRLLFTADALKDFGATKIVDRSFDYLGDLPFIVRPASGGSALGVVKVNKPEQLGAALLEALAYDKAVLVERFITGVELAVSLYDNAAGQLTALPPVQIKTKTDFFDTAARLDTDLAEFIAPPLPEDISSGDIDIAISAAKSLHTACGLSGISRVDLIMSNSVAYLLEANVSPGMSSKSLFPLSVSAAGLELGSFLRELLENA